MPVPQSHHATAPATLLVVLSAALLGTPMACGPSGAHPADCAVAPAVLYADADGDSFGDPDNRIVTCDAPTGYVADSTDCDDANPTSNPAAVERCDAANSDEDCDGVVDDRDASLDPSTRQMFYDDVDGDGFGDAATAAAACDAPANDVTDATDCDDAEATVHPGAAEVCDGFDTDCEPASSESGLTTFFARNGAPDSAVDHTAEWAAGTADNPARITLTEPGTLAVCAGEWHAAITMTTDVDLVAPNGAEDTTISAGRVAPVVTLSGGDHVVTIRGLTLRDGAGAAGFSDAEPARTAGGGVTCRGNSTLNIHDAVLTDNAAELGGGVATDECLLYLWYSVILGNTADEGGGVYIRRGSVELNHATVVSNTARVTGGGIAVAPESDESAFLAVANTVVSGNTAPTAGGLRIQPAVLVQCYGDTNEVTGFLGNTSETGGAVLLSGSATFESLRCDFGAANSTDDNAPTDVTADDGDHAYADDADFVCYRGACEEK